MSNLNHQTFYRSILTSRFRTSNLINFLDAIGDDQDQNALYLTFGMATKWSDREEDVGFAPPYPLDDLEGVSTVWQNIEGVLKVNKELIDPVIPRRDWGDTNYSSPSTFRIGDIVVTNTARFNKTDDIGGWTVYRCIDVPSDGGCSIEDFTDKNTCIEVGGIWTPSRQSIYPPEGRGDAESMGVYPDGYVWEYLYTIPLDVAVDRCTNELLVVPTPQELKENPARWGYQDRITHEHELYDLIFRVKAVSMRFRAYLDAIYFPSSALPSNNGFRQISLILNPLESKKKPQDPNKFAKGVSYTKDGLMRNSGEMIYIENRPPIYRSMDQAEQINIIFEV